MSYLKSLLFSIFLTSLSIGTSQCLSAQENVHPQSTKYEWPAEADVKAKLDKWQDQKFGIIIHWGLYAVPGIMESWNLCSEDWIERDSTITYEDYKKWYWGQMKNFNPVNFNPDDWAKVAKDAGMRYLVGSTCLTRSKQILKYPTGLSKTIRKLMWPNMFSMLFGDRAL